MRKVLTVAAVMGLLASGSALAGDQATGWRNWADHAERVMTAVKTGDRSQIDAACMGTTRTMISQGFQFPYWAQMLPQFCGVVQTGTTKREVTLRGWMMECKKLRGVKNDLAKAKPVDVEPRAKPLADDMAAVLGVIDEAQCSHPPRRH